MSPKPKSASDSEVSAPDPGGADGIGDQQNTYPASLGSADPGSDESNSVEPTPDRRSARATKLASPSTEAPRKRATAEPSEAPSTEKAPAPVRAAPSPQADLPTIQMRTVASQVVAQDLPAVAPRQTRIALAARVPEVAPAPSQLTGVLRGVISALVNVASLVFNAVQAVEALVTGPPQLPATSTVTVRSSTMLLSNGQRVAANWYYPEGDAVPEHMILLQHGFFALGPMYSYTAASLAERTQSVVVTPTLSSNPLAGDRLWLGGTGMARSVADLFTGDRAALTQSAMDAGFAARYGVDARLPHQFALAGHSLGANLVSGAAGFLAQDCKTAACAADDLVGVILLDGVPLGSTLGDALQELNAFEARPGGHYVPVREIGAPLNLFNFPSRVNADLAEYRSGRFNGVVLEGGVHMDSMRGGNPLIQLVAYLVAGFPKPQNPPAVDQLSATWLNQWFAGDTNACGADGRCEDDLAPGSAIEVSTPRGTARGIVIGATGPTKEATGIQPSTPATIPRAHPELAKLAA